ncbi:hypothetical protein PsYK624_115000 [Phanerochaete sordida]|uniref:Uncharacterized protein n=1 Tax=Phanerochaete sordida TaxID=48140 RepID=A0A9P3GI15_9APHY|nr:hypothetical protein PsYK624_115000 [Phanerochaete sordida]
MRKTLSPELADALQSAESLGDHQLGAYMQQSSCNLCSGGVLCLGPTGIRGMPRLGGENAEKALEKLVTLLCLLKLVLLQEIACTDTRGRRRGRRIVLHAGTTGCDGGRKQGALRGGARRGGGMRRWG